MFNHDYVAQLMVQDRQRELRKRAPKRVRAPSPERRWRHNARR